MCNTYNLRGNMKQLALFSNSEPPPDVEIAYESIHPDYVAPVIRRSAASTRTRNRDDALGLPAFARPARVHDKCTLAQHVALATVAWRRASLPCAGDELCRVDARTEPGNRQEGNSMVWAQ